jgi:uncharacterized protein (TIGR02147 family)
MNKTVFDYIDYKLYLRDVIELRSDGKRGFRSELAKAAGVQLAFLYQVLKKEIHFNLEHAERLNRFLEHSQEERHYFLLLVQFARAGSESLREYFRDQMNVVHARRVVLKKRLKSERRLEPEDQMYYYSAWFYGAIRVAMSIPSLQSPEALSVRLKLSLNRVKKALNFLVSRGLAERRDDRYVQGNIQMHLGNDSAMISRHHSNWRIRAMASLDEEKSNDLHYSYVATLSKEDAVQIKALIVNYIEEVQKRIAPSKEETIYSFCVDFFEL